MEAARLVESIRGWLRVEDASKLYELAYATPGPVLEIGTAHGKSAILMALAMRDAGRDTTLFTLDVDRGVLRAATAEAQARGVADLIVFVRGTVRAFARAYPQVRPALTFVDADHSAAGVERDLAVLRELVPAGGLLVFHDFNDPLNEDPNCDQVKVRPTVNASWVANECEFEGVFGACGLFRRRYPPPPRSVTTVDLLRLDSAKDQYLHRLRYQVGRAWRRGHPKRSN